jgi:ABC-type Fe3+ transport system permease subunit
MQPPQNPYGQAPLPNPSGGPSFQPAPAGTSSTTSLIVTGVLGIICCPFLAPYTWIKSNQALQALQSGYGNIADQSTYNIARILGIIGTGLWILGIIGRLAGLGTAISQSNTTRPNTGINSSSTR